MNAESLSVSLYGLNFALLFTHQIDSAYWKEWELFHIPGGAQLNLVLNFLLLVVALTGFSLLSQGLALGNLFALVLAGGGMFAFAVHSYFLSRGDIRFRTPVSIVLLVATLAVSIAQAVLAIRAVVG